MHQNCWISFVCGFAVEGASALDRIAAVDMKYMHSYVDEGTPVLPQLMQAGDVLLRAPWPQGYRLQTDYDNLRIRP
jgi:hypothetical protein